MSVLSVDALRERINTPVNDAALAALLETIEARLVQHLGAAYEDSSTTVTETHRGEGPWLFLNRRATALVTIHEATLGSSGYTDTLLTDGRDYLAWLGESKVERRYASWGAKVTVVYKPADDRAAWREAEIDLARIALSRSALKAESVGGEYSFTAPDSWTDEEMAVIQRLMWLSV